MTESVPGGAVPGASVPGTPGPPSDVSGWPGYWTINFCPNPSAEVSLAGYVALTGTETLTRVTTAWSGAFGVQAVTPGTVPGEGISTPPGTVAASASGSAGLYLYGETGALTVTAVQSPGGEVLGSVRVVLNGSWQRAVLGGLPLTSGLSIQLLVSTSGPQAITFTADAVQYEPDPVLHAYIDGDSVWCAWEGTSGLSASFQAFRNPAAGNGSMVLDGSARIVAQGETFETGLLEGQMDASGDEHPMAAVSGTRPVVPPAQDPGIVGLPWEIAGGGSITAVTVISPASALDDFAIWAPGTDPDPALCLLGVSNAGTANGQASWSRSFGAFSPPRAQYGAAGHSRWNTAVYMAAGFKISGQAAWTAAAPNAVNVCDVQAEPAPLGATGPSAYTLPRQVSVTVKPTSANYAPNPSFEETASGWTAVGGATLTRVSDPAPDDAPGGAWSLQVSVPAAGGGVYLTVPYLITGDEWTAAACMKPVSGNITDVTVEVPGAASGSTNDAGSPYGGGPLYPGYGQGPYGGVNPGSGAMNAAWYRPSLTFAAPAATAQLAFLPVAVTGATYPLVFEIDCVMITPGGTAPAYADGNSDGWQWELGGTPGETRSYYYEREGPGAAGVRNVLSAHIPLGLSASAPRYAVPPRQ